MKSVLMVLFGIIILTSCRKGPLFVPFSGTTIGYIHSRPLDQTAIAVFSGAGILLGTASCTSGDWREAQDFFRYLQTASYTTPIGVILKRELSTNGYERTYQIIGRY